MKQATIYEQLAKTLSYPEATFRQDVQTLSNNLKANFPDFAERLSRLSQFVNGQELCRVEEAYTATFDISAVCALDVGYQLFGEDYKRGALLVELARIHRESGGDTGTELADHLPRLLSALPRLKSDEERSDLVTKLMLPAMEKMMASFPKETGNVYRDVIEVATRVLESDFGPAVPFPEQPAYSAEVDAQISGEAVHV